jgi:P-type Ca2+ transporter type 2C
MTSPAAPPIGPPYGRPAEDVAASLGVDPATGLSAAEVEARRKQYGTNELAAKVTESGWHAFLRQYLHQVLVPDHPPCLSRPIGRTTM